VWAPPPPSNQPFLYVIYPIKVHPCLSGLPYSYRRSRLCGMVLAGYGLCGFNRPWTLNKRL